RFHPEPKPVKPAVYALGSGGGKKRPSNCETRLAGAFGTFVWTPLTRAVICVLSAWTLAWNASESMRQSRIASSTHASRAQQGMLGTSAKFGPIMTGPGF
ncbi:hypothetical protein PCANC_15097, partial [Puccinia coronata f. sp. avenae]